MRSPAGFGSSATEDALARHVITENARVRSAVAALRERDLPRLGKLLDASHESLKNDYEVSIPELDLLVELAGAAGAYGARLLGGGFGGSVLVLTDGERADAIAGTMAAEYRRQTGREGRTLAVHPSSGASVRS